MSSVSLVLLLGAVILSPALTAAPLLSLRLRANETASAETWQANFKAIAEHLGCCDEIWFSTGCGVPDLDWHRANAAVLGEAVQDCRARGIVPSLQFQATLGHGDAGMPADMFVRNTEDAS